MQLMANGHNGSISRAVLLVEKENVTAREPVPTQPLWEAEKIAQGWA